MQAEYNELSTDQAEKLLMRLRFGVYEQGDKNIQLPAHQICKIEASQLIPAIRTSSGEITADQGEINKSFKDFYSSLYTLASVEEPNLFDAFFQNLQFLNTDQAVRDALEKDITSQEISAAISSLNSG